jgi:hypothetical protein
MVDLCGMDVLDRLPGRWVLFERDFTELYGDWRDWNGMRSSNLGFLHELRGHGGCTGYSQPFLPLSDECGTPDF